MTSDLQLVGDVKLDGKLVEGHIQKEQTKLDRGLIGHALGSNNSIPKNVAAVIAIASTATLIISVSVWAGNDNFGYKGAVGSLTSLVTLTVGYLFGRSSKD